MNARAELSGSPRGSGGRAEAARPKFVPITDADFAALVRLWRALAEFPASEAKASRSHALESLRRLIGGERAWWIVGVRDRADVHPPEERWRDWRAIHSEYTNGSEEDRARRDLLPQRYAAGGVNLYHRRRRAVPGLCHVARPREVMTAREWSGDENVPKLRKPRGLDDQMVGTYFFDPNTAVHVGIGRSIRMPRFDERSRGLLRLFFGGAHGWIREQLLGTGWIEVEGGAKLSPRESDVVRLLLTDLSEKQIADRLSLTVRSAHQYVTTVYRRFGVSGRAGLMALWLRHRR